jgi:DNA helicase-2/ATP-dependent DNA helicase PcrA
MSWSDGLEGPHLEIARSEATQIGILAGPGTGKTTLGLMRRIARLLAEGVPGDRILLVSFTRVAAADLRDKIAELDVDGADAVRATTLHSYCLGLLRGKAILAITHREPRILLEHERDLMLRDIGGDFGDIHERRALLRAFEAGWARRTEDHPGLADLAEDRVFEASVLRWLRDHRAMLIGEVVPIAYAYLSQNPASEELTAFDHLIVDEYQDLNTLEQHLLDVLASRDGVSLCIAGDDDQSIYAMRYAHPEGIREFLAREETKAIEITKCGRCPRLVLSMANTLISCAPSRDKPDLDGVHSADGTVAVVQWDDLDEEIDGIVAAVTADIRSERRAPGDILILTHRRLIGERMREGLRANDIAAESYFREEELRTERAREGLALLRLAVSPDDAPALRVVLGLGDSDGRSGAYRKLWALARERSSTPAAVLELMAGGEKVGISAPALVSRFEKARKIIQLLDLENLPETVDRLFPADDPDVEGIRRIALEALVECGAATEFLDRIIVSVTQEDVPQRPDFVRIMSLHKSKGLTSQSVFVVGLMEGLVPTIPPKLPAEAVDATVAEQRRLLFVALTRAADQLTLSSSARMELATARGLGAVVAAKTIRKEGDKITCGTIASRYMTELGVDMPKPVRGIDWLGA